jgi:hypothetical protein
MSDRSHIPLTHQEESRKKRFQVRLSGKSRNQLVAIGLRRGGETMTVFKLVTQHTRLNPKKYRITSHTAGLVIRSCHEP